MIKGIKLLGKKTIAKYQSFYDLIKYGPDFICSICHRSLFENQVKPLSKALKTKVKIGKKQYECATNEKSFDGKLYVCDACYTNLKNGKMPKYAVVNGNELPFVPPQVKCLNEGEE